MRRSLTSERVWGPGRRWALLALAAAISFHLAAAQTVSPPADVPAPLLVNARRPLPGLLTGGLASDEDFARLAGEGYKTVVDLRSRDEVGGDRRGGPRRRTRLSAHSDRRRGRPQYRLGADLARDSPAARRLPDRPRLRQRQSGGSPAGAREVLVGEVAGGGRAPPRPERGPHPPRADGAVPPRPAGRASGHSRRRSERISPLRTRRRSARRLTKPPSSPVFGLADSRGCPEERGFDLVAVEGDWPGAARVDR